MSRDRGNSLETISNTWGESTVVFFDTSPLCEDVIEYLNQRNIESIVVDSEREVYSEVGYSEVHCFVVDPANVEKVTSFVDQLRGLTDVPFLVWGNDLEVGDIRDLAQKPNVDHIPKPESRNDRVFYPGAINSLGSDTYSSLFEHQSSQGSNIDEVMVSIIRQSVFTYRLSRQVRFQLDAIESSNDGLGILDSSERFVYTNQKMADIFEFGGPESFIGNSWRMCYDAEQIEFIEAEILPAVRESGSWSGHLTARKMDGSTFDVNVSITKLSGGGFAFSIEDVSEEVKVKQELSQLYEYVDEGFVSIDDSGEIVQVNQTAIDMLDISFPEKSQNSSVDLFEFFKEGDVYEVYNEVVDTQESRVFTIHFMDGDRSFKIRMYPSEFGVSIFINDITDHMNLGERVEILNEFAERTRDGFFVVDGDSHEIIHANQTSRQWLDHDQEGIVDLSLRDALSLLRIDIADLLPESVDNIDQLLGFLDEGEMSGYKTNVDAFFQTGGSAQLRVEFANVEYEGQQYVVVVLHDISSSPEDDGVEDVQSLESVISQMLDPVVIIATDTWEVVSANDSAEDMFGRPLDQMAGIGIEEFVPDSARPEFEDDFEQIIASRGDNLRQLSSGQYVPILDSDGRVVRLELVASIFEIGSRELAQIVMRPVDDVIQHRLALGMLNEISYDLFNQDTQNGVVDTVISSVSDLPSVTGAAVYLYNQQDGVLEFTAASDSLRLPSPEMRTYAPGDSEVWGVYRSREIEVLDSSDSVSLLESDEPFHSEILASLGSHGVVCISSSAEESGQQLIYELADILSSNIEVALDRLETVLKLKQQERNLRIQKGRLEFVSQLNEQIRGLNSALVGADSKDSIRQDVCESLSQLDAFDGVWIGQMDRDERRIAPQQAAGVKDGYLTDSPLDLHGEREPHPAVRAWETSETVYHPNISTEASEHYWADLALRHEYKSCVSIPLVYDQVSHGVLVIYSVHSDTFNDHLRSVLDELGSLIAYGFHAVESRNALVSEGGKDLVFDLSDSDARLVSIAEELDTKINIRSVTPIRSSDDEYLVYCRVKGATFDMFDRASDAVFGFEVNRAVGGSQSDVFEVIVDGTFKFTRLDGLGAPLKSLTISPDGIQVILTIPDGGNRKEYMDHVEEMYPGATLHATSDSVDTETFPWLRALEDILTEKQRRTLQAAYTAGYFESPSETTGSQLAERLGVSQTTVSQRIRGAMRNLFGSMWDSPRSENEYHSK